MESFIDTLYKGPDEIDTLENIYAEYRRWREIHPEGPKLSQNRFRRQLGMPTVSFRHKVWVRGLATQYPDTFINQRTGKPPRVL